MNGPLEDKSGFFRFGYRNCAPSADFYDILVFNSDKLRCGIYHSNMDEMSFSSKFSSEYNLLDDNYLIIPAFNEKNLTPEDYITLVFYRAFRDGYVFSTRQADLVAVDKTEYRIRNDVPVHQSPSLPVIYGTSTPAVFNGGIGDNTIRLERVLSTDSDTPDNYLDFELNYATSTENLSEANWRAAGKGIIRSSDPSIPNFYDLNFYLTINEPGDYAVYLRAKDDFGLVSPMLTVPMIISIKAPGAP